jgi:hypothetical protein
VLNLPDGAAHRRLRCPKCETRFYSGQQDSTPPTSAPAVDSAGVSSSILRPKPSSEVALPVIPGSLRDTFDLPLLDDSDAPLARPQRAAAGSLFEDLPAPRKTSAAEARSKARRCPVCGSVVLAGMSLCERCGLDLDTGQRFNLEEEQESCEESPAELAPPGPPAAIVLIGIIALATSAILALLSLVLVDQLVGKLSFSLVCAFGLYASIQFLRGKSFKLLLIAMMLGGIVNVIGFIILPIVAANEQPIVATDGPDAGPNLDENSGIQIKSMAQDPELTRKLGWGVGLLLFDAAAFIYLATASSVHRYFHRRI